MVGWPRAGFSAVSSTKAASCWCWLVVKLRGPAGAAEEVDVISAHPASITAFLCCLCCRGSQREGPPHFCLLIASHCLLRSPWPHWPALVTVLRVPFKAHIFFPWFLSVAAAAVEYVPRGLTLCPWHLSLLRWSHFLLDVGMAVGSSRTSGQPACRPPAVRSRHPVLSAESVEWGRAASLGPPGFSRLVPKATLGWSYISPIPVHPSSCLAVSSSKNIP